MKAGWKKSSRIHCRVFCYFSTSPDGGDSFGYFILSKCVPSPFNFMLTENLSCSIDPRKGLKHKKIIWFLFYICCTFNFNQKIYLNSCLRNAIGNLDQKCKYPSEDFVYRWYPFMLDGCGGKIWNMTARDFYECQTSSLKSSPSVLVCRYYSIDFGLVGRLCGFKNLFYLHKLTWHYG